MSRNPIAEKVVVEPPGFSVVVPSLIVTAVLSLTVGYWLGKGDSLRYFSKPRKSLPKLGSPGKDFEIPAGQAGEAIDDECKLVLVVRTDLGMGKGKAAAQCGHATLACYKSAVKHYPEYVNRWEASGQMKVALQVKSEDEMLILQATAMSLGLTAKVIHDAGRTQIAAGSATVLGIGPGPKSIIDQVTGHLKLL